MSKLNSVLFFSTAVMFFMSPAEGKTPASVQRPSYIPENIVSMELWSGRKIPYTLPSDAARKEHLYPSRDGKERVADVKVPAIYCFPAPGKGPHPAVIVAPGGGYSRLAWSHEGKDICALLQKNGFTAFLLKYRCPSRRKAAHMDAARAVRLIRFHAKKFNVDPKRVGAIGFSAGAHLVASISAPASDMPYPQEDPADKLNFRPDFTALIYPAYLVKDLNTLSLSPELKVDSKTPPSFLVQTGDDGIKVENSLAWYRALKQAKVSCEMHIWATGGHGYGIWRKGTPVSDWHIPAMIWFKRTAGVK